MNFLKQALFLLVLVAPITCMPVTISNIHFPVSDDRKQDIFSIVKVIGKAVESELASINFGDNIDKENGEVNIDLAKAEQFLQQKLPVIVTKVSNVVKHGLTKNQQTIVIDLLHNLQSLSSFTKDELVKMAKIDGEDMVESEKYIPEELKEKAKELSKKMDNRNRVCSLEEFEESILINKELDKIDFHNESVNLVHKFMRQCDYCALDILLMATIDLSSDKAALPLQKCCDYLARVIGYVVGSYIPSSELWVCGCMGYSKFEKIVDMFGVVNSISSALLKSIK